MKKDKESLGAEFLESSINLLTATFLSAGVNDWINAQKENDAVYTTVDIHLPNQLMKEAIYSYLKLIKTVTGLEAGYIESMIFGQLIVAGLIVQMKNLRLYSSDDAKARVNAEIKKLGEVVDRIKDEIKK